MKPDDLPSAGTVFVHDVPGIGRFSLRQLDLMRDVTLLHRWLTGAHAVFWGMQTATPEAVADYFRRLDENRHAQALIGCCAGLPVFLLETYDPRHDPLAAHYEAQPGDKGMHFLTAPPERPVHGFTRAVMGVIQAWLFSDPGVRRIVVEPAVANDKIHPINLDAGFVYQCQIDLPGKRAWLAFCRREDFAAQAEARR
ncbi:GNAT family N-acetyltransferase [Paludibacterium sp.]|uniref:GNAT family N-acetyltransferase n=1 Tax=Paludibacterium sp. TaxID=1917523 RepID=UPI0025DF8E64|nr:GNAT family N-acetyltransferase [Paludibacterium sp.]MBV8648158.1 acetyltransferase [Paludibacterium sp.]